MSQRAVKWKHIQRYFTGKGFTIRPGKGGEKCLVAPKGWQGGSGRSVVRIGHKYCTKANDELPPCYIAAIKRAFGVSRQELLDG